MLSAQLLEENIKPMSFNPDEALQPLPKEITDEIRNILEECWNGKRLHKQTFFATKTSCGTAHCLAGWKVFDDFKSRITYCLYRDGMFNMLVDDCDVVDFDAWEYARNAWTLTDEESDILFASCATFREQFRLLEQLERGRRF